MKRLAPVLLAALLCLGAAAPDPREAKFVESMHLAPGAKVRYFDEKGRALGFDAFFSLVMRGRSFNVEKDKLSATVRLNAIQATAKPAMRVPGPTLRAGSAFPAFALQTTAGAKLSQAALRGKPTLVNFFFADCAPCIAEIPVMNAYARKHPEVRLLAVTFDDAATAKHFVAKRKLQWPVLADGQPLISEAGIVGFPTFVLVGKDGRVLDVAPSATIAGSKHELDLASLEGWVDRPRR